MKVKPASLLTEWDVQAIKSVVSSIVVESELRLEKRLVKQLTEIIDQKNKQQTIELLAVMDEKNDDQTQEICDLINDNMYAIDKLYVRKTPKDSN